MEESQLEIDGNRIAVYESGGSGPAVLLIHGNSANAETFRAQLGGDFGARRRVVALDLPGHGRSAPAADPERTYTLEGYAGVVAEVARRLALERPVVAGWSLGGHIALEAADLLPDPAGILIYGTPPIGIPPAMEEAFLPNPAMAAAFSAALGEEEARAFAEACLKPGEEAPASLVDGAARARLGASVREAAYRDEVEIVASMTTPLAVLHGEEEQLVNVAYIRGLEMPTLWRGEVQIVEDAGHAPHLEQPERFNELLAAFVEDVTAARS